MKQILIVDDEVSICDLLLTFLRRQGYQADAVHDGEAALEWLAANNSDMLLLDIRMPGISGMDVLKKTRQLYPELPVIVISGYADEVLARKALREGAHDFFFKPFDLNTVEARIFTKLALMDLEEKIGGP